MATRFEIALTGGPGERLRAAAEEALDEIERLENLLSLYRPFSDIGRINASAATESVRVSPETFRLLQRALEVSKATAGAFDVTAGPLIKAWGFMDGGEAVPPPQHIEDARKRTGWSGVFLSAEDYSVRFARPGMMIDLGSIGKGYALDRAAGILAESGVTNGLIHGGTSSIIGIGPGPAGTGWKVALPEAGGAPDTVDLIDGSLSVSGVWGKSFKQGHREFGHVIDPRTGHPVQGAGMAAVVGKTAMLTDALSTALLVLGSGGAAEIETAFPGYRAFAVR